MSSSEDTTTDSDPDRGEGKGSGSDDDDDPAGGFEDDNDSQQVDAAQQTLAEIESVVGDSEEGVSDNESGWDTDNSDVYTASELRDETVAQQIGEELGLSSEGVEQVQSLGESGITPDAKSTVNIDNATEFKQFTLSETSTDSGENSTVMWIARTESGDKIYITFANDESTGNPLLSTQVASGLHTALSEDAKQRVGFPDLNVDTERGAAVLGNAGADDSNSASAFDNEASEADFEKQDYLNAVAAKVLIGDTDVGENIIASSQGNFHPVDYDDGGTNLAGQDQMIAENDGLYTEFDGVYDRVHSTLQYSVLDYGFEINKSDIRDATESLADEVDIDKFESELTEAESYVPSAATDNMIDNIETVRQGEI